MILVVGGLGGVLMDRLLLPYVSTWPVLRNFPVLNPSTPIVINKREEVRIDEGINYSDITNRVQSSLVMVYFHEGKFGAAKFKLLSTVSGAVVTSDGVIVVPAVNPRPDMLATVIFSNQQTLPASVLASDSLTGVSFLKVEAHDLPVLKQGFSRDARIGQRLVAVRDAESAGNLLLLPLLVSAPSYPAASLLRTYDFGSLNVFLSTEPGLSAVNLGAVVLNSDASLWGFVTLIGKSVVVLRSEDLKLVMDNFLTDQKIVWPNLKLTYEILGESQATLLGLRQKNGVLLRSAAPPLRENDFIYGADGQVFTVEDGFQQILLSKKPGDKVRLQLLRAGRDEEMELTL